MTAYTELIQRLIKELSRLPGIGPRSAERIMFHLLKSEAEYVSGLTESIQQVKARVCFCETCNNLSEEPLCRVCADLSRNRGVLCVVEEPKDVLFLEKSKGFNGLYHVLLGALSPLAGVGPRELRLKELEERVKNGSFEEVIIATNCTTDGEATALYITKLLRPYGVKITRIACGVPRGSNLEYVDQDTLACALAGRLEVKE